MTAGEGVIDSVFPGFGRLADCGFRDSENGRLS